MPLIIILFGLLFASILQVDWCLGLMSTSSQLEQNWIPKHALKAPACPQFRLDFRRSLVSDLPSPRIRGRSAGSFSEQRLVIEPMLNISLAIKREKIKRNFYPLLPAGIIMTGWEAASKLMNCRWAKEISTHSTFRQRTLKTPCFDRNWFIFG